MRYRIPVRRHTEKSKDEIDGIVKEKLSEVGLDGDAEKMPPIYPKNSQARGIGAGAGAESTGLAGGRAE